MKSYQPPRLNALQAWHALAVDQARVVRPEILDELPQDCPAARASRRDLRVINGLVGNPGWFRRVLRDRLRPGEGVLEIGAGSGELGRTLNVVGSNLAGLDLVSRPGGWPEEARWFQTDVLRFNGWVEYPVVIVNLFLHHLNDAQLGEIGALLGKARLIVACETLRARRALRWFALAGPVVGAHAVTRHDGRVSILAGFRNDELPRLLGLDPTVWQWQVRETWLGMYRMVAERRS